MKFFTVLGTAAVLLAAAGAKASAQVSTLNQAALVSYQGPSTMVTGYADCDKSHSGTGGWGTDYYDDTNGNGKHDPGEPFADTANPGWGNPKSASDNSCWLASACNMLEQLGVISSASALYDEYALNRVPSPTGTLTWDDGGLQEYAIQYWADQHPGSGVMIDVHWRSTSVEWTDGMFAWEDWSPRSGTADYLSSGWEVGIGMWPLYSDGNSGWHGGGHALTLQSIDAGATFDCTDSDRDWDWNAVGDLNTYTDATRGPESYIGHLYYAWYNDFYDGDIEYYPAGDVGYVCAVIPEPATLMLMGLSAVVLLRRYHSL